MNADGTDFHWLENSQRIGRLGDSGKPSEGWQIGIGPMRICSGAVLSSARYARGFEMTATLGMICVTPLDLGMRSNGSVGKLAK